MTALLRLGFLLMTGWGVLAAPGKPNILWITAEDMSPNLGCYGDDFARSPNIDALAAQSVRYSRAFATAPVCAPSRACLITGMYATSLGNPHLRCTIDIPDTVSAYTHYLRQAGYYCSNNVKTDYNLNNEQAFVDRSWDASSPGAHWRHRKAGQPFFAVFNLMESHQSRTSVWSWEEFEALATANLKPEERADPGQVPLPPYYPDTPLARRSMARYYDCIQVMDRLVGRILKELDEDGLADETIVFFYSDHGMGMPRGKRMLYHSGMHVPLLIRFPAAYRHLAPAKPGRTLDRLVSFVDFPPTLLNLAGVGIPGHMQGMPFLGSDSRRERKFIYGARDRVDEAYETSRSVFDGRWLYIRNYFPHLSLNQPEGYSDNAPFRREITRLSAEGKLSGPPLAYAAPTKPVEELYDTRNDPHQVRNLAGNRRMKSRLKRLRERQRDWVLEHRDLGFIPEQQLAEQMGPGVPHEWARESSHYDLERILAAAKLVGHPESAPLQVSLLKHGNSTVRYWAAVGLRAAGVDSDAARQALESALEDVSLSVRVEAAGALVAVSREPHEAALTVLGEALNGGQLHGALHAARTLQLLGEKARPVLPEIQRRYEGLGDLEHKDKALQMQFALEPLVTMLK